MSLQSEMNAPNAAFRQDGPLLQSSGAAQKSGSFTRILLIAFVASMLFPVWLRLGGLLLMPHRILLLATFFPALFFVLSGKAGKIRIFDVLVAASTFWAVLALIVNGSNAGESVLQQVGIYSLETLGAYLLARMCIRTSEDFYFFVKIFLIALMILVPFAILESVTHRAIMLDLIPGSVAKTTTADRWGLRRAQTVFAHPILFGVFSAIGVGIFWYSLKSKFTRLGGAALAAAGTFFSLSSGALIAVTIQGVLILWELMTRPSPVRWRVFMGLCIGCYVLIDLLSNRTPFHILVQYGTFNTGSAYNRILIWRFGMENVWENPYFGLGMNIWQWKRPSWMSASADNYWLLVAMQFGIPTFLFLSGALFVIIRRVSRAVLTSVADRASRAGYLTSLGGLIVAGGTVHYWHGVMAFVLFVFGSGVYLIEAADRSAQASDGDGDDANETGKAEIGPHAYSRHAPQHARKSKETTPPGKIRRSMRF